MSKINYFEWEEILDQINRIGEKILNEYYPDIIISVVRGGMVPSVILSHRLNVRKVLNINVLETVNDEVNADKHEPIITNRIDLSEICGKKILLVDDILGTGATIRKVKDEIKKWKPLELKTVICVVNEENWEKYNNSNYIKEIDYIGKIVRGWVIFPWEK